MANTDAQVSKVSFFTYSPHESALELYRFYSPLKAAGIEIIPGVVNGKLKLENIVGTDLVCIQRNFSRYFAAFQSLMTAAHRENIPVLMDLDDNLLELPPDHTNRLDGDFADSLPALMHALMSADALTVTTPVLKEDLERFNPKIYELQNYLDGDLWPFREPKKRLQGSIVKILFMGTPSHVPDIRGVDQALREIAIRWGKQVQFFFFGALPPAGLSNFARVEYQPMLSHEYSVFLEELNHYDVDIAIAPLQDNSFNRCKSAIKFMEYSALGLAGVYAALAPYQSIVRDGENGFLASNIDEWIRKLNALIQDPDLCVALAKQAQRDIQEKWLVKDHGREWQQVYNAIARKGIDNAMKPNPMLQPLASIALQMDEIRELNRSRFSKLQDSILYGNQQIEQKDKQIDALKEELAGYANSSSWKLTRPLRQMNRMLTKLRKK